MFKDQAKQMKSLEIQERGRGELIDQVSWRDRGKLGNITLVKRLVEKKKGSSSIVSRGKEQGCSEGYMNLHVVCGKELRTLLSGAF